MFTLKHTKEAIFRGVGDATGNAAISEIENLRSDAQLAATESETAQGYAEEWANKAEDSLVSTAAGGDGVDDYSALHWSIKSSDSATLAAASLDEFTDIYLGAKASNPTVDNDGDALQDGALYFNTTSNTILVYDLGTTTWLSVGGSGLLAAANNLSDVDNVVTARSNLGLEIGVDVQAYDATIVTDSDIGVTVQGYDVNTAKYDDVTANFTGTLQNGGSNVVVDTDIGTSVQAFDADTAKYDDVTANFTGTLQNGGSNVVVDSDIGSSVQAFDVDTAKYDDVTANFTGTLQNGGSNVVVDTDIGVSVQAYDADTAKTDVVQSYTAGQSGAITALTDGANIATNLSLGNFFSVTLAGNRTLDNPTNLVAGQSGSIFITQDGTGSRTLAYGSFWDFTGGTAPTLSTAAGAVDRLDFVVRTTGSIHAALTLAVA